MTKDKIEVINVSFNDINKFCIEVLSRTAREIERTSCLVVGIEEGGVPISENFYAILSSKGYRPSHITIRCQRPSSKTKKNTIGRRMINIVIRTLPQGLLNKLRILEHHILSKRRNPARKISINKELPPADLIFIFDDAVDSGHTLKAVHNKILTSHPNAKILTAAFVVTQKDPVYEPNFYSRRNVLVRFPWASDA